MLLLSVWHWHYLNMKALYKIQGFIIMWQYYMPLIIINMIVMTRPMIWARNVGKIIIISLSFMDALSYLCSYFRNWKSIFCEFIPEMVFILSIFGYMLVLIVAKWLSRFENTSCAPSILVGKDSHFSYQLVFYISVLSL